MGKTRDTAAIASAPSRATKYVFTMPDMAPSTITAVVGSASATIARSGGKVRSRSARLEVKRVRSQARKRFRRRPMAHTLQLRSARRRAVA